MKNVANEGTGKGLDQLLVVKYNPVSSFFCKYIL